MFTVQWEEILSFSVRCIYMPLPRPFRLRNAMSATASAWSAERSNAHQDQKQAGPGRSTDQDGFLSISCQCISVYISLVVLKYK